MVDNSAAIAADPAAPAAERYDAQVEQTRGALASLLIPSEDITPAIAYINDQWEDQLAKGGRGNLIQGPWAKPKRTEGAISVMVDDFQIVSQGNYWDRPGLLGFDSMRAMVEQTPILNSIVMTRIRQVMRFCRPQMDDSGAGFLIRHVDRNVELDETQQASVKALTGFIMNCGWESNPRRRKMLKRDNFTAFMAKSVRDTLTMDAAPIETEFKRDKSLGLDGFYAVDGSTIRLCTEDGYEGDDSIIALQVIQGNIRASYDAYQMVYEVRNPRTDVTACGYGYSETEMLIRTVTYLLNAMTFNGSFFDKNSVPRGILNIYGQYSESDLAAFKRYWNAMSKGAQNAHNLPVLASKNAESKAEFTEIGGQMNEMAFGKWLTFLTSISCAIYGIAPEEISMESFATQAKGLGGNDTEEKLVSSNDKGLRPLLAHYENVLSDFVIQEFSQDYQFRFAGLDAEDAKQRFEMVKLVSTVNEGRAAIGADALEGPLGDAPLNPGLLTVWQAIEGVGQPEEPQGDFGNPDAADAADKGQVEQGEAGPPGAATDPDAGAEPATRDGPDFGKPPADEMSKAMAEADFGLPPIYVIEG